MRLDQVESCLGFSAFFTSARALSCFLFQLFCEMLSYGGFVADNENLTSQSLSEKGSWDKVFAYLGIIGAYDLVTLSD